MMEDPTARLDVLPAAALRCTLGAAEGAALPDAPLVPDDCFALAPSAEAARLTVVAPGGGPALIIRRRGAPDSALQLGPVLRLASDRGDRLDAVMLIETTRDGMRRAHLHPTVPMRPGRSYRLLGVDADGAAACLARASAGGMARGTRIAGPDGRLIPIEAIGPGVPALTRDGGVQIVRQVATVTARASGPLARVTVEAGTFGAAARLTVSAAHPLHVDGIAGAGPRAAASLIDGRGVHLRPGGFADWVQIAFDAPQVVFAEGVPVAAASPPSPFAALCGDGGR